MVPNQSATITTKELTLTWRKPSVDPSAGRRRAYWRPFAREGVFAGDNFCTEPNLLAHSFSEWIDSPRGLRRWMLTWWSWHGECGSESGNFVILLKCGHDKKGNSARHDQRSGGRSNILRTTLSCRPVWPRSAPGFSDAAQKCLAPSKCYDLTKH
jgi:hypothetical protein